MSRAEQETLLTVREAAKALSVTEATIRAWILRRERLTFVKVGRSIRVLKSSIDALITENTYAPKSARGGGR